MRTTLILNDELALAAKKQAAAQNTTLAEIVNEALRLSLFRQPGDGTSSTFSVTPYSPDTTTIVHSSPTELHDLLVAEEQAPYRTNEA